MKAYELLFFVAPNTDEETRAGVMKRIDVAITAEGGVVDSVEDWGKRKLAFEIDDIAELDRVLRINDAVKRHMVVCRSDRD